MPRNRKFAARSRTADPASSLSDHVRPRLRAQAQGLQGHGRPACGLLQVRDQGPEAFDHARQALWTRRHARPGDHLQRISRIRPPFRGRQTRPIPRSRVAIWTQGEAEDNHHWLPCYDYPNDRVTTEMIITVARPLSVVSNGPWWTPRRIPTARGPSTGRWTSPTRPI